MTDMHIIDRSRDIGSEHYLVSYAGIMTTKRLTSVLEVLDIVAMPYTQHSIHLAELNANLSNVS